MRVKSFSQLNENRSYSRVIPRDFFNESKLLKCMGQLSLKIHDGEVPEGIAISIDSSGEPFDIRQDHDSIYVSNYEVTVNNVPVTMKTTYNSKAPFPLMCEHEYNECEVFDDTGNFTSDFVNFAGQLSN